MKQKTLYLLLLCCCTVLAASCNKLDEAGRKNITGTVTLDGTTLEDATILFSPLETKAPSGAGVTGGTAKIKDGKYELKKDMGLYAGTYKVLISHKVVIDPKTKKPLEDMSLYFESAPGAYKSEEFIPAKYNTKTELEITVGEEKNQTHNFELTK